MNGYAVTIRALLVLLSFVTFHWSALAGQWTDETGRSVQLDNPPQRIVSLVPSVTETLFALGAQSRIVGVTDYCDYPAEARQKNQIGAYADPNLEAIVAARPDLVFASAEMNRPAFVERIERMGIAVYVINPRSLDEVVAMVRSIAHLIDEPSAGRALADAMQERIDAVQARAQERTHPKTLFTIMTSPLIVAGPGTLSDDLLRMAGGVNVVEAGPSRYPGWGVEGLLAVDPAVIVATPHTQDGSDKALEYFARWPQLQAVQQGRLVSIHSDLVHRAGPRLVDGLEALHDALHPREEE
ncbi:ABC transporter substrate-binding protein [Desulfurispira natronophila]|uniref:Iron complex transport system substrate-binding protein n=1 Tax=Desulfurispira natronophila TaxID=682562 RepID=A0A7W8DHC2_9BACT|nr:cobalamin-binding protein [Desulfurispira natronophila]MBB5022128.1 iron complex transport system substrate-binding protein [Desulfurispira natronophila]